MFRWFARVILQLDQIDQIQRTQGVILANQADLEAAIAAAPAAISDAVVTAVKPLIVAPADTQPSIDAINTLPQTVAQAVASALAPTA